MRSFSASFHTFYNVAFNTIFAYISCIFLMKHLIGELLLSHPCSKSKNVAENLEKAKG